MSDFDQYAGGGFSSVGGYNDPAGSQAEEQQRMLDDQLNQQRLDQESNDAALFSQQEAAFDTSTVEPADSYSSNQDQRTSDRRQKQERKKPAATPRAEPVRINSSFALIGFVVAGTWGLGLVPGDGQLFGALVAGLFGAYVAGRYHQILIAGVVVGGGWWFLSHLPKSSEKQDALATNMIMVAPSDSQTIHTKSTTGIFGTDSSHSKSALSNSGFKPKVRSAAAKKGAKLQAAVASSRNSTQHLPSILQRPHQPLVTDVTRMRQFQQMLFAYEKRTGKSFLTDHRSMRPLSVKRYDYFSRYDSNGLIEGRLDIAHIQPLQDVWDYQSPQLWEIDLEATVNQSFLFTTTYPNGKKREDVMRTYDGDGLCYHALAKPLQRDGRSHAVFRIPVAGGTIWRDFVTAVYHATTDDELLELDPMNQAITETHRKVAEARKQFDSRRRSLNESQSGLGIWSKTMKNLQQGQSR